MQVVGDDHPGEGTALPRHRPARLEVGFDHLEPVIEEPGQPGRVPVDGDDGVAPAQEIPGVAPAPARHIEHRTAGADQAGEALDPPGDAGGGHRGSVACRPPSGPAPDPDHTARYHGVGVRR